MAKLLSLNWLSTEISLITYNARLKFPQLVQSVASMIALSSIDAEWASYMNLARIVAIGY